MDIEGTEPMYVNFKVNFLEIKDMKGNRILTYDVKRVEEVNLTGDADMFVVLRTKSIKSHEELIDEIGEYVSDFIASLSQEGDDEEDDGYIH